MISLDVRHAIARAVAESGFGNGVTAGSGGTTDLDPGLRPGGRPGQYASSVAFGLVPQTGGTPWEIAHRLAGFLAGRHEWIAEAEATGPGYLTITVTPEAIAALPERIAVAGPDCVRSDALAGREFPAPPAAAWQSAATWDEARERLATQLTARLAVASGAVIQAAGGAMAKSEVERSDTWEFEAGTTTITEATGATGTAGREADRDGRDRSAERTERGARGARRETRGAEVAAGVAFAGTDAVLLSLARAMPRRHMTIDPELVARHVSGNPAYAVRYAHARAVSGVRWAAALGTGEGGPQRPPANQGEPALLDALSWLPERVANAARRGRPDEFVRFLEDVARLTLAALTSPGSGRAPGSDRLALARAAQAGLAASLELLRVSAPDRLLDLTGC